MNQTKNIFITGGTSGLGLELAQLYLNEGHRVATCSFESPDDVQDNLPAGLKYYQADVTQKEPLAQAIRDFTKNQGSLDLVVANAGISMPKTAIPDFDRGRKVIEINVIGVLNTFEPAIEIMKEQNKGQLVALGSIAGLNGLPGTAIYSASKAAVLKLCEAFAIDLKAYGIHVTALAPGFISTPLTEHNKHKMPFLMTPEQAVAVIKEAIDTQKTFKVFPFPLSFVANILHRLPRRVYRMIMDKDLLGLRG